MSYKKRFDANKVNLLEKGGFPYIVRMGSNNGQKGFINGEEKYLNEGNTISFGQDTATMYYQENPYFTGDKIKILRAKDNRFGKNNAFFFIAMMNRAFSSFSWGASSFSVKVIGEQKIFLPVKNKDIHFEFMESFIAELEAERIAELEAYLLAAGLKDYNLTSEEQAAINIMQKAAPLETLEVTFSSLFENIQQGRRLKKDDQILGEIPFVMAGVTNTGVANYISNPIAKFPENSITIDIFGNTFYRSYAFGAGDDTGVYWSDKKSYSKEQMLFFTAVMGKSLLGKYSYGEKLRSSRSLDFKVNLPAKNGLVNYQFMETLISAVQKLVIKDVVDYADKKLTAAHHATQQSST